MRPQASRDLRTLRCMAEGPDGRRGLASVRSMAKKNDRRKKIVIPNHGILEVPDTSGRVRARTPQEAAKDAARRSREDASPKPEHDA